MAHPAAGFSTRPLTTATLKPGETWRRLYQTGFPDPLGWGPGLNRFSDPTGTLYGIVYLGSDLKVCFLETILRDRADGLIDALPIGRNELDLWSAAAITVKDPVVLVDLTGDGPVRMGVPSDVVGAKDQTLARIWSEAFWRHKDQVDGILFPSRLNEQRNVALFDRALPKVAAVRTGPLMGERVELARILDDLNVAVVRPPGA
jgi:hypothetical protein